MIISHIIDLYTTGAGLLVGVLFLGASMLMAYSKGRIDERKKADDEFEAYLEENRGAYVGYEQWKRSREA